MYKIVIDSCGELPEELKQDKRFSHVALTLDVDGVQITDDETFDQASFLKLVKESPNGPKSACPSPGAYLEEYKGEAEHVYVVTLSGELSGSYNSALCAAEMYHEEFDDGKQIHVFNSKSASIGETLIALYVQKLEESGLTFEEVVQLTEDYIESMNTFFVLETLETFRKTGRLSRLKSFVANTLNIKPVMASTQTGYIYMLDQARGMKKALTKMIDRMIEKTKDCENKIIAISHCNCPERAEFVKSLIEKVAHFKKIVILDMAGVSSMYANDGGIIIAA